MIKLTSILNESAVTGNLMALVKSWENNKNYAPGGWNKVKGKWFPHESPEGGNPTIAYGHKLTDADINSGRFVNGITDSEAQLLLKTDLTVAEQKAKTLINNYNSLPILTQQALINACYRGELGTTKTPTTLKLMNAGDWKRASEEYLNHDEYKEAAADSTVKQRMNWNATQFAKVGSMIAKKSDSSVDKLIGKTIYPRLTPEYDYATVRTSPEVNTGLINNEQVKIKWPNPIGVVTISKQIGDKTWYRVNLPKNIGNGTGIGWVRGDVVTADKDTRYK